MKLYFHPAACSLSPHIVCRELDLPVELVDVDRATHRTPAGADYLAINGNGYVPALELADGTVITEGPAIVQHLADLVPGTPLLPPQGTIARTQIQSLLNYVTSELHKPMAMLFRPDYAPVHEALRTHVHKRLDWVGSRFAGPYLTGDAFTVADAYLFVCVNWSPWIGIDLDARPVLQNFMRRAAARPAVRAAIEAEELLPLNVDSLFHAPRPYVEATARLAVRS